MVVRVKPLLISRLEVRFLHGSFPSVRTSFGLFRNHPLAQALLEFRRIDSGMAAGIPDGHGLLVLKYKRIDAMHIRAVDEPAGNIQKFVIDSDHGDLAFHIPNGLPAETSVRERCVSSRIAA